MHTMRISSVNVSNVLSFAEQSSPIRPVIAFPVAPEKRGSIHTVVGSNGAGKSNLLEIISSLLKATLTRSWSINPTLLSQYLKDGAKAPNAKKLARDSFSPVNSDIQSRLKENYAGVGRPQVAEIRVLLGEGDRRNIDSLVASASRINAALEVSSLSLRVPERNPFEDWRAPAQVVVAYVPTAQSGVKVRVEDGAPEFLADYVEHFGTLESISLYLAGADSAKVSLVRTFAIIAGGGRDAPQVHGSSSIADRYGAFANLRGQRLAESVHSGAASVFEYVRLSLTYRYFDLTFDNGGVSPWDALSILRSESLLTNLNNLLMRYLGIEYVPQIAKQQPGAVAFGLRSTTRGADVQMGELSSGQRSLVHLIFALYGPGLGGGAIVIDEPELHLHPQFQRLYMNILESASDELDLQVVLATHAPSLIDAGSFGGVIRAANPRGAGTVLVPGDGAEISAELVRTLDYSGSARVVFGSTAILVEGETDQYFLRCLIRWLIDRVVYEQADVLRGVEVVAVGGKGGFESHKKLFEALGLSVAYVADWDNAVQFLPDLLLPHVRSMESAHKRAHKEMLKKGSRDAMLFSEAARRLIETRSDIDADVLTSVVDYILVRSAAHEGLRRHLQNEAPADLNAIGEAILLLKVRGIHLLPSGELEDYLRVKKGLESMVRFCLEGFENWMVDEGVKTHRLELLEVLRNACAVPEDFRLRDGTRLV